MTYLPATLFDVGVLSTPVEEDLFPVKKKKKRFIVFGKCDQKCYHANIKA